MVREQKKHYKILIFSYILPLGYKN